MNTPDKTSLKHRLKQFVASWVNKPDVRISELTHGYFITVMFRENDSGFTIASETLRWLRKYFDRVRMNKAETTGINRICCFTCENQIK